MLDDEEVDEELRRSQYRTVPCPFCNAKVNEPCTNIGRGVQMRVHHTSRRRMYWEDAAVAANTRPGPTVPRVMYTPCPTCAAQPGMPCRTYVDGGSTGNKWAWYHQARLFEAEVS